MRRMSKRTRVALEASIEHWVINLQMLILNHLSRECLWEDVSFYVDDCALCHLFYYKRGCIGCPVREKTEEFGCCKSPWEDVYDLYQDGPDSYPAIYRAIVAEIEFLESLRDQ